MAERIPEDKINEIRQAVDIVDVVSDYVQLKNKVGIILDFVRFMEKTLRPSPFLRISKYIIVSDVEQVEMHSHS